MKLLRYGPVGQERPGLLDDEGKLRDLSSVIADIRSATLSDAELQRIAAIGTHSLPLVEGTPRLAAPVAGIGKFIAIGPNCADHAAESDLPLPVEPMVFTKSVSCIVGPTSDEVGDTRQLGMWLDVNGQRRQTGHTSTMVFDCATILGHLGEFMTLMTGDVATTGTPPGVGLGIKPDPVFLKAGDVITLGIDKLGEQRQCVVAWKEAA